jgi:hypothetical protein
LIIEPHPCLYYIQWPNSSGKFQVNNISKIHFSIGTYHDSAYFNVAPIETCALLFGKPWVYENNAPYNDIANTYSFRHNGKKIWLLGMAPIEILEIKLTREQSKKIDDIKDNLSNSNDVMPSNKSELPLLQDDCTVDSFDKKSSMMMLLLFYTTTC